MSPPLVSVIIPTLNRSLLLEETLQNALSQDYGEREIIVVDDGSLDDTRQVCSRYPVQYLYQEQSGCSAAKNKGVRHASGVLVAFLDDDDLWPPGSLAARVSCWLGEPTYDHIVGKVRRFQTNLKGQISFIDREEDSKHMFNLGAGLMLKRSFESIGGFDESLSLSEDTDLWFRMREAGMFLKMIPEICLYYRRHDGNVTAQLQGVDQQHELLLHSLRHKLKRIETSSSGGVAPFVA